MHTRRCTCIIVFCRRYLDGVLEIWVKEEMEATVAKVRFWSYLALGKVLLGMALIGGNMYRNGRHPNRNDDRY